MCIKKINKALLLLICSLFFSLLTTTIVAQETHTDSSNKTNTPQDSHNVEHAVEKEFDVTETILEHIKDNHSWHLFGHTSISLPVILISDKGVDIFSSSNLVNEHHLPKAFASKYNYKVIEGKIKVVNADESINEESSSKIWDFSITKNVASLLISVLIILALFISVANAYKKTGTTTAPKGLQSFIEPVVLFVRDEVAKPTIGHHYKKFMPLLLTIFFLILTNNFLGLIPFFPGSANVSGNIAFTMMLAMVVFVVVNLNGNKNYWQHIFWMPGMHWSMKLFLAPIELIGVFVKPISLMIRLFANITAGHVLVLSLICLIFIFKSIYASAFAIPFAVFISLIELLVAFLQAFIFTMLSGMYIGMAIEEHHH
jgi:F-type H+-transporting ATPase subunit a